MRSLSLLATALLSTFAMAQSPLVTLTGGTNSGNVGGGIYFDLQVNTTVTINRIDFYCGAVTVAGSGTMDVYLGPTTYLNNVTNLALWQIVGSTTSTAVAPSTMATGNLVAPFCLGPGSYGVALKSNNFDFGYTNGTGNATPGSGNGTFSNAELTLRAGAAQNAFLTGPIFTQRIFNGSIYYTLGGTPISVAAWETYGQGCYGFWNSFYELMGSTATGMNLANTSGTNSLLLSFIGTGYNVSALNHSGTFFTPTSTALTIGNNSVLNVATPFTVIYPMPGGPQTTNSIEIADNGYVTPNGTNPSSATAPSVAAFLSGSPRWGNWHDFDPAGAATPVPTGGGIFMDVDPSNQAFYVTWNQLPDYNIASSQLSTFQLAFFANGNVEFRWQTMSLSGGGGWPTVVGWTPGGNALDPGTVDLSTSAAFTTGPRDNPPLTLGMSARPRLGTTPQYQTGNIPTGTSLGAVLFGFGQQNPGISLGFLGMPGCFQYLSLTGAISNVFVVSGTSNNTNFLIPNLPQFNGTLVYAQSATFSSGFNPLGVIASNGVRMLVGSL